MNDYAKKYEERRKQRLSLASENRVVILEVLKQKGVKTVSVEYDGYGDQGQLEDVTIHKAEGDPFDHEIEIKTKLIGYGPDAEVKIRSSNIKDAILNLFYDLLEVEHAGWENNEGAFGEFVWDIETDVIDLDHNERYEASTCHSSTF